MPGAFAEREAAPTGWRPALSGAHADDALAAAREVGSRLRDPERLARAIELAPRQSSLPEYAAWEPVGLAQGHSGLAVLFRQLALCFPAEDWDAAARGQLELAVAAVHRDRAAQSGMISGLAGVAFAAQLLDPDRYAGLLETLDGLLVRRSERIVGRIDGRQRGCAEDDVDVVSGLAGIGAYFLSRGDTAAPRPILASLVRLLGAEGPVPAWHTPTELLHDDWRRSHPAGVANCGLAHGLPGPLALLALACSNGVEVGGQREAVARAAAWLVEHVITDEWGPNWAAVVSLDPAAPPDPPTRAAWCYGAPGVARALWLAGDALGDDDLRGFAVEALEAVHRRPRALWRADGPTFCHGLAGVLQITLRAVMDSGSAPLHGAAQLLAGKLVECFEPGSIAGFRDAEPDGTRVDQAGVLHGAAGVALTLLAAASPAPPRWDRMFLLA